MKVVIAPDSFKESLTAEDVASSIANGLRAVWPDAEIISLPMADGGEGTVTTLTRAVGGEFVTCAVFNPLSDPILAEYGLINGGRTAVIEVAAASGLALVPVEKRDPTITSSIGTGALIVDALEKGVRNFIIGIGGSATNDGGFGIAMALGYAFQDVEGENLRKGGLVLGGLDTIDDSKIHPFLRDARFKVACDVNNPLCGPNGATRVYGPQKGATPEQIEELETAMVHYAGVLDAYAGRAVSEEPGAGAAGGIGAGLLAFTNATLEPGVDLIAEACGLEEQVLDCDLVITGEGKIDSQTEQGKVPDGVARIARKHGKPVVGFCGTLDTTANQTAFAEIHPIDVLAKDTQDAMENAGHYLEQAAESFARAWK
jgi:glycerate kinase